MFIENKYYKWYHRIILCAKFRKEILVKECHHILPRSLGGNNSETNLVDLTPREHYVCHLLLTRFTIGPARKKLFYALHRMTNTPGRKIKSSKIYEYIRANHSKAVSERCKGKSYQEMYNKPYAHEISDYQKQQIAKSNSSRIWSTESRIKMSVSQEQRKVDRPDSFSTAPKSTEHRVKLSTSKFESFRKSDDQIFLWKHIDHGIFIGTRSELRDSFSEQNLKVSELLKVINPKYPEKSYKGWFLAT